MGAAFLCGVAGIENRTCDDSASSIPGWLRKLQDDTTLLVHATAQAQRGLTVFSGPPARTRWRTTPRSRGATEQEKRRCLRVLRLPSLRLEMWLGDCPQCGTDDAGYLYRVGEHPWHQRDERGRDSCDAPVPGRPDHCPRGADMGRALPGGNDIPPDPQVTGCRQALSPYCFLAVHVPEAGSAVKSATISL